MRTARFTYKGAYHHIISRGLNGMDIFLDDGDRIYFCRLLEEKTGLYGISLFAYSIMRNHYHLVIRNTSGRMSDMMRVLNGGFGVFFRKKHGGKGYLFQDRYHSTLIENKKYAWRVVQYALVNPSVSGICKNPFDYRWSSINCYFSTEESFVDTSLIESLFETEEEFRKAIDEYQQGKMDIRKSRFGYVFGDRGFEKIIKKKFDRRKSEFKSRHAHMRTRREISRGKTPTKQILKIFSGFFEIEDIHEFLKRTDQTSRRKADILIKLLKDEGGMCYREISEELGLAFSSLGHKYRRGKESEVPRKLLKLISGGK
jgi:REP element-mobilizing transposase RayT